METLRLGTFFWLQTIICIIPPRVVVSTLPVVGRNPHKQHDSSTWTHIIRTHTVMFNDSFGGVSRYHLVLIGFRLEPVDKNRFKPVFGENNASLTGFRICLFRSIRPFIMEDFLRVQQWTIFAPSVCDFIF